VFVANYGGGSIESIPLEADGRLGAVGTFVQHAGSSVNPARQSGPHAHSIYSTPDNRLVLAADLGLDRVLVYRLDTADAKLTVNDPAFVALPPGSGPRHLVFHPNGKFVYVINEMLCTVAVFRFDAAHGALTEVQTVSTLPSGQPVETGFSVAEIAVHPSGRFLYGSNRGHNSIAVFALDPATGRLTHVENQSTRGATPRHFALDPTGAWLLAENQDSGDLAIFRIDGATGRLAAQGAPVAVPTPVCAVFVPAP
jgi:6-phosphogluconolactonase